MCSEIRRTVNVLTNVEPKQTYLIPDTMLDIVSGSGFFILFNYFPVVYAVVHVLFDDMRTFFNC
jgi:hypothetical protein